MKERNHIEIYLSANRRSKYRSTPITLAASTSIAARALDFSASSRSRGFGSMCSLGSQEESSSLARENLGCRESVVKASAQESVKDGESLEPNVGLGAGLLRAPPLQHPPSAPLPPQHPPPPRGALPPPRDAARVLQKSVLRGSAIHWAQVPGPLAQGLVASLIEGKVTSDRTSPSDGGGVNCDKFWIGASRLFSKFSRCRCSSS